ncbi:DUF6198 family protein [uncultured Subdoligranulum sp.]|uniref:DUF6198 family protein n=1 Tax=uncultured Subdoligranulum sp. TaxID=512298 RepID=UPI003207ED5F
MHSVQAVPQRVNAGHEGRIVLRGELALTVAVIINSFAVALTVYAGLGISPVSSFPYAVSLVFPFLTLGTWTYLFQGALVITLMILRRRFVPTYLFSFVAGFFFGTLLDVFGAWLPHLPLGLGWQILYFAVSAPLSGSALRCPTAASCPSSPPTSSRGTCPRSSANPTPTSRPPMI